MTDWDRLRGEARKLEMQLEDKVQAYSRLAQRFSVRSDSPFDDVESPMLAAEEEETMARGIENLLADLADCNERMSQSVTSGSRAASAALLKRYREILFDYKSEFRKLSATIQRKKERADLLGGVGANGGGRGGDGGMRHLYAEQNSINSSMRTAGGALDQANESRDSLRRQRDLLQGGSNTLTDIASQFPGVNQVIDAIRRRRTRENVVMGLAISACLCFTIWYMVL